MAEVTKYQLVPNNNIATDFKGYFSIFRTRKTSVFVYGVIFVFIAFTIFLAFSPSNSSTSTPSSWFLNFFTLNSTSPPIFTLDSPRSDQITSNSSRSLNLTQIQPPFSQNFTDTQIPPDKIEHNITTISPQNKNPIKNITEIPEKVSNLTDTISPILPKQDENKNPINNTENPENLSNLTDVIPPILPKQDENKKPINNTENPEKLSNLTSVIPPQISPKKSPVSEKQSNFSSSSNISSSGVAPAAQILSKIPQIPPNSTAKDGNVVVSEKKKSMIESLVGCDLYDGGWVRDETYPLYKAGSCKLIDEQFNCFLNGRPDHDYQKLKWKPNGCTLPRLDGRKMLNLLRGKRLVFVGDSLNRNMWESLVCILKNSVKNPKNVYEASGRHYFRNEASYSFVFKDYNCTVEFFVAPFLVQEWEVKEKNGATKETLRLDLVVNDSEHFKNADFVIFNTGHWWTHEKTSKGEDYYQEGSNVYKQLDVMEAFRKAITTWGRWVDTNINPQRTHVFFRGYSSTHFRGGQWNSGGQCDSETEPITNDNFLEKYPWKMRVFETVMKGMKTPVSYLNITKLTDYRKDGHPSIYRKLHPRLSIEEKRTPLKFQDCSHWCLPGVPDSWNELLYAEMLRKNYQEQ